MYFLNPKAKIVKEVKNLKVSNGLYSISDKKAIDKKV
jgi:hypothetical protein